MTVKRKTALLAAALAAVQVGSALAQPVEPIRIGIMDLKADAMTYEEEGVEISYREFNSTEHASGRNKVMFFDHGEIVLTAAVRSLREMDPQTPIKVYSANVFIQGKNSRGETKLKFQYDRASEALEWMHSNGVRVVVTAFNSQRQEESARFMDRAEELGMIVYAGASNVKGAGRVWPAADPRSISVADTTPGKSSLTLDVSVGEWVQFGASGQVPFGRVGKNEADGSSFATPKAAAYGAYWVSRVPTSTRSQIVDAMRRNSENQRHMVGSHQLRLPTVGSKDSFRSFVAEASRTSAQQQVAAKGPTRPVAQHDGALMGLASVNHR